MMLRRAILALCLAAAVVGACALDAEVDQDGEYAFFPSASPVDTDARPLSDLLIIEQDASAGVALVTLLRGELPAAGIGFEDLRSIAARHGPFQMVFDTPQERRVERARELLEDDELERVTLELDGEEWALMELDGDSLSDVGATRWLRTLSSNDFDVRAYAGVVELDGSLRELELEGAEHALGARLSALLDGDTAVELEEDEERVRIDYAAAAGSDYQRLDLLQPIERLAGDASLDGGIEDDDAGVELLPDGGVPEPPEPDIREAIVRNTLPPDAPFEVSFALLTDAFGQGCWSLERPLRFRVTQVARDYVSRPGGDLAVIHHHTERFELPDEGWKAAIGEAEPASYCESYRPGP